MQLLSKSKLETLLKKRGLTLSELCKSCGISRQSLYTMLRGASIYNVPFTKMIQFLHIDPGELTDSASPSHQLLKKAPYKIQKGVLEMQEFCRKYSASLLLFGSQVKGRASHGSDWDFGVHFNKREFEKELRQLKYRMVEKIFPYRIDMIVLNHAPPWFLESIREESILLEGSWPKVFKEVA